MNVFLKDVWKATVFRPLVICILVFSYILPFGVVIQKQLSSSNLRQETVMNMAENLTDPVKDCVYDGIGMVPTRSSIHFNWFLHSSSLRNFQSGAWPYLREMLAAKPAAVIIRNYRMNWLSKQDSQYIASHYVMISDDFLVLGKVLQKGGGSFEICHEGRYRIATLEGSDLQGTYPPGVAGVFAPQVNGDVNGKLDGVMITNQLMELSPGTHYIECASDCQATIVWVGPKIDRIGRRGGANHESLFID